MYAIEHRNTNNDWVRRTPIRKKTKQLTLPGVLRPRLPGDPTFRNPGRGSNAPRLVHFVCWQRKHQMFACALHPGLHCTGAMRAAWGGGQQSVLSECRVGPQCEAWLTSIC